ncbi:hypothetical protein scyTo_0010399 [Scyliorhinus torazame]|uniref:Uncharacterized protein n=1 Tax=Scyliorhinus torazame TaxID=75743 RepID=A0A401P5R4_SCYTO|nr:hypothetical protein [Scyliorhinus torazame]
MEVKHDRLPEEPYDQLKLKTGPREATQSPARGAPNLYSAAKKKDYTVSVYLNNRGKSEHPEREGGFWLLLETGVCLENEASSEGFPV